MLNRSINPWWTVVAGFLGSAVGAGTIMVYAYGILSAAMGEEFGWRRDTLSLNMTAFLVGSGLGTVFLGWLIAKLGIRRPAVVMAALFGLLFAAVPLLPPQPSFFPPLFLIIGLCGAACSALPYAVAISGFFDERRGLALGIVVAGSGAGSTFGPALAHHLVNEHGWRAGFGTIGLLATLISVAGLVFLVRTPAAASEATASRTTELTPISDLLVRNPKFWLIAFPILGVSVATFGGMASLVPYFRDRGIHPATIAAALSVAGFTSWGCRVAVGYALDKVFAPIICAITFTGAAAGLLLLVYIPAQAFVGAALVAMALGAEADLLSFLVSRYFRLIDYSRVLGVLWVVWAWGGGVGTWFANRCYDQLGSYGPAFLAFAGLLMIGTAAVLHLGPYSIPVHKRDTSTPNPRLRGFGRRLKTSSAEDSN